MAPNDMAINKVGMPKSEMTDAIPSYEAAAAVKDSAVQGEQGTRPTEINNIGNVRKNDSSQKFQTGYEGINSQMQLGKLMGLSLSSVFNADERAHTTYGSGLSQFGGTREIGKSYHNVEMDGMTVPVMKQQGQFLNIGA